MDFKLKTLGTFVVAELQSNSIISSLDDALDLIGNAAYQGASHILIKEENLHPDFFDLKTKFAGEILQKFSTYGMDLSVIGDYSKFESKSLNDFIYESNKTGKINFVSSMQEAEAKILSTFVR